MKRKLAVIFSTILCTGSLIPTTVQADQYDHRHPDLVWVHRHFIWVHGHRVFWVPGHPGIAR
jgi:hypothetical protein